MVKTILELKSEKNDATKELRKLLTNIEKRDKKPNAEERTKATELKEQIEILSKNIEEREMSTKIEVKNTNNKSETRKLLENNESKAKVFESRTLTTSATPGSYLVPAEKAPLERALFEQIPYLEVFNIKSSATRAVLNCTISEDTVMGEVRGEGSAGTSADPTYRNVALTPFIYSSKKMVISNEEIESSVDDVEADINQTAGERIANKVALDILNGDGTGKIKGLLQDITSGATVANASFGVADVVKLYTSVSPARRKSKKAFWMMNSKTLGKILSLLNADTQILLQYKNENGQEWLIGCKVYINENMDDIGVSKKPMIFGDGNAYFLRYDGTELRKSSEAGFAENSTHFYADAYMDGRTAFSNAIKYLQTT